MDCRDKPGNDAGVGWNRRALDLKTLTRSPSLRSNSDLSQWER
jgi:hypothetical protein